MQLYQNKIILKDIKKLISSLEFQNAFINKLFNPLKKTNSKTFLEKSKGYIGVNTTEFMNGNYGERTNKNCKKPHEIIRKNIKMLNNFVEQLQDNDIFNKMLDSVENIVDVGILNAKHKVFKLIEEDIDAMPKNFVRVVKNYIDTEKFYEALLFLIMWSIYGEQIEKLAPVYEKNSENTQQKLSEKKNITVKLLTNTKPCRPVFKGRDELLLQIYDHFQKKEHFLFLQGTGGIGKSELAKRYAEKYRSSYDVIVFAECGDSLISAVNDNVTFSLTEPFVSEHSDETEQQFYERKLNQLRKLSDRILVILDNVDYFSKELESFLSVPFDVIITTRYDYSLDYLANTKFISEISIRQTLREIFSAYYGKNVNNDLFTDMLIDMFECHTMAIELVAKQMKASNLTPEKMYKILKNNDESELNETFRVLNYDSTPRNITSHMQRIFNIASFNEDEQYIMMCLSLLPLSGMDKGDFKKCCNLKDYSAINSLIERSWVREADDYISVHALIQETIKIILKPSLSKCFYFIVGLGDEFPAINFFQYIYSYTEKTIAECIESDSFDYFLIEYLQSRIAQQQGNLISAINYMSSAVKRYTEYFGDYHVIKTIQLYTELGDLYRQVGDTKNAVICYKKAVEYMQGSNSCMELYNEVAKKLKEITEK